MNKIQSLRRALARLPVLVALVAGAQLQAQGLPPASSGGGGMSCDPKDFFCTGKGSGGGSGGSGGISTICKLFPEKPECSGGGGTTPGGGVGGGTCSAPPGGSTSCGGGGPSSLSGGAGGGVAVGGGNPINLLSGNKYQEETDLAPLPGVLGLEFVRRYNSLSNHAGMTGANWRHSYETVLYEVGNQLQIVQADGRRLHFARVPGQALCVASDPSQGQVRIEKDSAGKVEYHWRWADGRTLTFSGGRNGGQPLQRIQAATGEAVQLQYSPLGDLIEVKDPQGRKLRFHYAKSPQGVSALASVDTPLGRLVYQHDNLGRLTQAAHFARKGEGFAPLPQLARDYHYEAQHQNGYRFALTGISQRMADDKGQSGVPQRISTYAYDAEGRGVLSVKGLPLAMGSDGKPIAGTGIEQIRLAYLQRPIGVVETRVGKDGEVIPSAASLGKVELTNALGAKSQIISAVIGGQYRMLEFRGAGCAQCGPANRSYGYDRDGRLVRSTELDAQGHALRSQLNRVDAQGRLIEVAEQTYAQGKPLAAQWRERFEYEDRRFADGSMALGMQPVRMLRPSVVAGKVVSTSFERNAMGQLTRTLEQGWSPVDAQGRASPMPLARSVRYAYTRIGGRSLLTGIDGPLPNGPKGDPSDSDVTRLRYDSGGNHLVELQLPGLTTTRYLAWDEAGRVARLQTDDGYAVREERFEWQDGAGRLRATARAWLAGGVPADEIQVTDYRFDGRGAVLDARLPDGRTVQVERDGSGHAVALKMVDGQLVRIERDLEGHVVKAEHVDSTAKDAGKVEHALIFDRNATGMLQGVGDALGTMNRYAFEGPFTGLPSKAIDALGSETRYRFDAKGQMLEELLAAGQPEAVSRRFLHDTAGRLTGVLNESVQQPTLARAQSVRYDDFGRKVWFASPEHGWVQYGWNAADQLQTQTDSRGQERRYRYNIAGQLIASGGAAIPDLARYHYHGARLVEERHSLDGDARHSLEVRQLQHDAWGRVVQESHWVAEPVQSQGESILGRSTITRFAYDVASGRLLERVVIDGQRREHRFGFGWDARTGQLSQVSFNGKRVVDQVRGNALTGLTAWHHANGLSQILERDARARVNRVRVAGGDAEPLIDWAYELDAASRVVADGGRIGDRKGYQRYQHDALGRLTAVESAQGRIEWTYDGLGNRRREDGGETTAHLAQGSQLLASAKEVDKAGAAFELTHYLYDTQGALMQRQAIDGGARMQKTARSLDSPLAPGLRLVNTSGGRIGEAWLGTQRQARYVYGSKGERLFKIVDRSEDEQTRRFHYLASTDGGQRLAAEATANGAIVRHYLYLQGQPVAVIDTPEDQDSAWARLWAQWLGRAAPSEGTIYAVHADRRGAAMAVSDPKAKLVWVAGMDAWGKARPSVSGGKAPPNFEFNLRLPGQYFDAETGLHDNLRRTYDPDTGRYVSPDPLARDAHLGLAAIDRLSGSNPYAYVGNRPLEATDPEGLYESDVHFYMTYFLAIVAGMGQDDARMMALAAQYVDDNPMTRPVDEKNTISIIMSMFKNKKQLKRYHFVLSGDDGKVHGSPGLENPHSEQLDVLYSYAVDGPEDSCPMPNNTSLQFMGEFLHAFEDTFSHRDNKNKAIDATWKVPGTDEELGIGHGLFGHSPDYTYNHKNCFLWLICTKWNVNEDRTFKMEQGVYGRIQAYMSTMNYEHFPDRKGKVTALDNEILVKALKEFNHFPASEHEGSLDEKIAILAKALKDLDYSQTLIWNPGKKESENGYRLEEAAKNRKDNFEGLSQSDYPRACLSTDECPLMGGS